jgi:hypothetical protein
MQYLIWRNVFVWTLFSYDFSFFLIFQGGGHCNLGQCPGSLRDTRYSCLFVSLELEDFGMGFFTYLHGIRDPGWIKIRILRRYDMNGRSPGDLKCREVNTWFCRQRSVQTGSSETRALAGKLEKPLLILHEAEWRERGYGHGTNIPDPQHRLLISAASYWLKKGRHSHLSVECRR